MRELAGRTAFVTGGASGIGLGMAGAFAAAGMKVAVTDVDAGALAQAEAALAAHRGAVLCLRLDVADRDAWRTAADRVERDLGPVQVLCNNAGVTNYNPVIELDPQAWDWVLSINTTGVFNGVHTFLPRMIALGAGGHIVNTASMAGLTVHRSPSFSAYAASKYAVVGFSESIRTDLAGRGIGVSVLCPGMVRTKIGENSERLSPQATRTEAQGAYFERMKQNKRALPEEVWRTPEEVGELVLEAIRNDEFYIITHPESRERVAARGEELLQAFDRATARRSGRG
ncbi:MAG: SDR family NAD(P)-dependent oxidoreductase [Gammaproteobacteria bacterium]